MAVNDHTESGTRFISLPPFSSVLIQSLRNIGYTMETALADIIDNSITAQASYISIQFDWNNGNPWVAIIDNGYGMSSVTLEQAMRFGSNSPSIQRDVTDLGRFGLGMKTASISQCRRITVLSKHEGLLHTCEWDLDAISDSDTTEWMLRILGNEDIAQDNMLAKLTRDNLTDHESGTIVLWRNLDSMILGAEGTVREERFNDLMDNSRKHLETVFHRYLSPEQIGKAIQIDFNMSLLKAFNPFGPPIPSRMELPKEVINIHGESVVVQAYILPHRNKVSQQEYDRYAGEEGYLQNQGFYVYRNKRLIMKATWFRLIKKEELHKLIRVRIDIPNSLDHLWNININKSQVSPPDIVRRQLKKIIHKISGRGKRVFNQRVVKLHNSGLIALWNREVCDGKAYYAINYEHPIINGILEELELDVRKKIISSLNLIVSSFPYDAFFSDAASDTLEINKEIDLIYLKDLCKELVLSLKKTGLTKKEISERIFKVEIPSLDMINLDDLINEVFDDIRI